MKKHLMIILSVILLAVIAAVCCLLPLGSAMPLPALPLQYRTVEVPSFDDSITPFIDDFPFLLSDAEDAAALAETVYSLRYAKHGEARRIPFRVTYDQQQSVYAVELIDAKYASAARKGQSVNLLGGIFTIYLSEKNGAVLAVEIQD